MDYGQEIQQSIDTPKAPSLGDARSIQGEGQASILERLKILEEHERQEDFFDLASCHLELLNLNFALYFVFTAWKLGHLAQIDNYKQEQFVCLKKNEYAYFRDFLKVHHLRSEGRLRESFLLLEELQKNCDRPLIVYRYAAESLNFYDLSKVETLVGRALKVLSNTRQLLLRFNLGIIALNQGQMGIYSSVEQQFANDERPLGRFFYHWLTAGFYQLSGQSQKAVDSYLEALALSTELADRKTDRPILAFAVLQQSVWAGDYEAARTAWLVLEEETRNRNNLSPQNLSLATALYYLNEGMLSETLLRFETLFEGQGWSKDHLRSGEYYLWILMARMDFSKGRKLIRALEDIRVALGFPKENLEHMVFDAYFQMMAGEISQNTFHKTVLKIMDQLKLKNLEKDMVVAKFLYQLTQDDPVEQIQAFSSLQVIPFLQRMGVALLSQHRLIPSFFRNLRPILTDELARLMVDIHLSRLTGDLLLFVQAFKSLSRVKAVAWIQLLVCESPSLTMEFGRSTLNCELLMDLEGRRVIAVESLETLDAQPLLGELALTLFRYPNGLDKEMATLGIGYSQYDPLQHDPIVYNLVSRLRDWLRKQGLTLSISSGKSGWFFNHRDLIRCYSQDQTAFVESSISSPRLNKLDLPPRLEWILMTIEKKGYISRTDLMSRFSIQKSTAANDFNALIDLKLIRRQGQGRGIFYVLEEKTR